MPPRSRTKPGSTTRRPKVAGLRQHAHAGAAGPDLDGPDASDLHDEVEAPRTVLATSAPPVEPEVETETRPETPATAAEPAEPATATTATTEVPAAPVAEEPGAPTATDTEALPAAAPDEAPATGATDAPAAIEAAETTATTESTETAAADEDATTTAAAATTTTATTTKGADRTRRRTGMTPRPGGAPTTERPGRRDRGGDTASPTRASRPVRTGGRRAMAEPEAAPQRRFAKGRDALSRFAGSRALPITLVVVIVVCLAVAGLAFWQGRKAWTDGPVSNQAVVDVGGTAELVGQSREAIEKIFSYDFTRLDDSAEAARTMSTGDFTNRYMAVFDQTIRQPALQQQLKQSATVVNIGVVSMRGDRAEVMALTQFSAQRTTTGQSTNAPGLLRLDMQRVDGRWKLAELTPLTANR
ncbi:hypothetical protein [Actinomycetospora chlora]|uniref:hypothetical protein n=1 Tax=Actinomycetospora chlora TaxID=663608 RepID=UPI0031EB53BA